MIYQAIETKYLGPTNHKGNRIKAKAWAGSITVLRDYALDLAADHMRAAMALVEKLGWQQAGRAWAQVADATETGDGYYFVAYQQEEA